MDDWKWMQISFKQKDGEDYFRDLEVICKDPMCMGWKVSLNDSKSFSFLIMQAAKHEEMHGS